MIRYEVHIHSLQHKDKVIARFIYHALSREPWDIKVFVDEFSIQPGEDINQKCLEKAKNADLGIVILSEYIQKSEYVPQEVGILLSIDIPKIYVALHESWKIPPGYEKTIKSFPLWEEKNPSEGINKLKELVRSLLKPKEIGAVEMVNKTDKLANQGRFEEALQYVERAIQIDPNYDVAYLSKISNLRRLHRYDEALQTCNKALTIFPEYTRALYYRGFLYWSMKEFTKAIKDFDKVLMATDGLDQSALFFKGRCLEKMDNFNEAIKVYEECYKMAPTTSRGQDALYRKSTLKARVKGKEKVDGE
ncbi:MAG: Tetratricopeptide repeat protein [Candidatus Argoarchaeum ethanivorans]|uniref:Tetratricopeptide repeat protein n=1 Tax=Candidatus Argoarchaeum ethanivorans TaxID=2608793 RepID=A0A811T9J2_9EURY|nr:MAG: Tetratricopeptide repeat protein [Candidatus Argoarchaeum ethanivorans]